MEFLAIFGHSRPTPLAFNGVRQAFVLEPGLDRDLESREANTAPLRVAVVMECALGIKNSRGLISVDSWNSARQAARAPGTS